MTSARNTTCASLLSLFIARGCDLTRSAHAQRMRATGDIGESDDYENVRVGRLPGQAEWGELPVAKKQ